MFYHREVDRNVGYVGTVTSPCLILLVADLAALSLAGTWRHLKI